MSEYVSLPVAAKQLGCSRVFLWKKCKAGVLPFIKVGDEFRVSVEELKGHLQSRAEDKNCKQASLTHGNSILPLVDSWVAYLTNVQALSPKTTQTYQWMLRNYLKKLAELDQELTPELLFERKAVMAVFARIPAKSFNLKNNTYIALRSFGNYLVMEGKLSPTVLDDLNGSLTVVRRSLGRGGSRLLG